MDLTTPSPIEPTIPSLPVARLTADQYLRMIDADILTKEDKVELIDGIIVPMSPAGQDHNWCVLRLTKAFAAALQTHFLSVQGTVQIGDGQIFDPDLALVRHEASQRPTHPAAADIDLVVEVSDSSLKKDQTAKCAAYATAGIQEYWIVDVTSKQVWVHRNPVGNVYGSVETKGIEESIRPIAFPALAVGVGDVFGS